ncbi:TPA: SDR family NAD(P)-dependent oxidoreductase, partial [Serratia fonticola]
LPLYAWQRERYWIESTSKALSGEETGHPLLGRRISLAGDGAVFESCIAQSTHGWLYDHRVYELAVMPGAGIGELIRAAGEEYFARADVSISALVLQSPLILADAGQHVQVVMKDSDGLYEVLVWSRPAQASEWQLHATAEIACGKLERPQQLDLAAIKARCGTNSDIDEVYQRFADSGLPYGSAFRGLVGVWSNENEVLANLKIPDEVNEISTFGIHPILLDLAFQAYLSIDDSDVLQLPFTIDNFVVYECNLDEALVYVKVNKFGEDHQSIDADVYVIDFSGKIIATAIGMCIRQATLSDKQPTVSNNKKIYELQWKYVSDTVDIKKSDTTVGQLGLYSRDSDDFAAVMANYCESMVTLVDVNEIGNNPPDILILRWDGAEYNGEGSRYKDVLLTAIDVIRQLLSSGITSKVIWLTRQAVKVVDDDMVNPVATALLTLARSLNKEFSNFPLYMIDADEVSGNNSALVNEIFSLHSDVEVAIRGGSRFVPRLNVLVQEARPEVNIAGSSILITGGLGAIGLNIARWLAQQGASKIALVNRNIALNEEKKAKIAQIESYGATVTLVSADVADLLSISKAMEQINHDCALNGIIHAAGVRNAQLLPEVTRESFNEVMSAKVDGAIHLDLLTRNCSLDFFILFSSVASTLSPEGQGVYAAANAFLDGLADYRHALGLPARSFAWGPWGEEGMVSDLDAMQSARLKNHGIDILTTADAGQLFIAAASCSPVKQILADLNLRAVKNYFREDIPAIWRDLIQVNEKSQGEGVLRNGLASMSENDRYSKILTLVCVESARVLSLAKAEDIEKDQSLRDKGLDSLMALELRKSLGKKVGLTLPATLALDHPTPATMADFILSQVESSEQSKIPVAKSELILASQPVARKLKHNDVTLAPLSLGQERLWFMDKLGDNKSLYNMSYGVKLSGELDIQRLRTSFAVLVARHESLRTTFVDIPVYPSGQEEPRALIAPRGAVPLDVIDLSMEQDRQSQIDRLAYTHRMRSFDISNGPLWRSLLITEEEHSHLLLLTQHHLITDAWSMVRLIKELVALYLSPDLLAEPQLAEPDYSDYVSYQRRSLAGEQHQQNLAWWQKKLTGLPRLSLPIAKSTPSPTHNGDAVRIDINRALTEQVRRFSQQNSCTVFVTLLSAWACTLYRYSSQTDFGIGTLSAGRENSDFDEVQGFFVNILVLRPALSASMSFAEFVKAMSLDVLESLRRQDTEFSEIAAGFTGSRSLDLNPLVQASFDFNTYPAAYTRDDFGYEWLDFVRGDAGVDGTAKFNLGLSLLEKSSGI